MLRLNIKNQIKQYVSLCKRTRQKMFDILKQENIKKYSMKFKMSMKDFVLP